MKWQRLIPVVCIVAATWSVAAAQDPVASAQPGPSFEIASIKPSDPGGRGRSNVSLTPGDRYAPNDGYFSASGMTTLRYIAFAFAMDSNPDPELNALPSWAKTERYDIEARAKGPATKDEMRAMVRSLLADRFKMAIHYEVRNMPAYVLTMTKPGHFGPQMRVHQNEGLPCDNQPNAAAPAALPAASGAAPITPPAPPAASAGGGGRRGGQRATPDGYPVTCGDLIGLPGSPPGRSRLGGRNVTIATFMATLRGGMDRPVVDQTGLTGRYDWWIEYVPDAATDGQYGANFPNPDPSGAKLWTALKEQLGLEIKPAKTNVNWLVFDHIERPSAN